MGGVSGYPRIVDLDEDLSQRVPGLQCRIARRSPSVQKRKEEMLSVVQFDLVPRSIERVQCEERGWYNPGSDEQSFATELAGFTGASVPGPHANPARLLREAHRKDSSDVGEPPVCSEHFGGIRSVENQSVWAAVEAQPAKTARGRDRLAGLSEHHPESPEHGLARLQISKDTLGLAADGQGIQRDRSVQRIRFRE
ncbi:MAG: hypothetical protein ABIR61_13835 [Casimicrobiaceae bacterium]